MQMYDGKDLIVALVAGTTIGFIIAIAIALAIGEAPRQTFSKAEMVGHGVGEWTIDSKTGQREFIVLTPSKEK